MSSAFLALDLTFPDKFGIVYLTVKLLEGSSFRSKDLSRFHTTQTSPGSAQVFENLGLAHASVDAKNLGSA